MTAAGLFFLGPSPPFPLVLNKTFARPVTECLGVSFLLPPPSSLASGKLDVVANG